MALALPLSIDHRPTLTPGDLPEGRAEGLYVHIPFCFHKCHYCDFYSITRQNEDRMDQFADRILAEAQLWNRRKTQIQPRTIFFGGGTPTLLPEAAMHRLIGGLRDLFDLSQLNEWTIEANPATLSADYAAMLREMGVDRLSFGAQSFDRGELARLERHHDPDDVPRSLQIARKAGFKRINIDLIYAIPQQTLDDWSRSLETAIATELNHFSCYGLTYEPNTALAVRKRLGQFQAVEEGIELEMFHHTRRRLAETGRPAYEISNYALPGEECRHNLLYWTGGNYIALGPSGASHIAGWRWKNRPHLGEWENAIDTGHLPAADLEQLSPRRRAGEYAMLALRLERGLNFSEFADYSGFDAQILYAQTLRRLEQMELLSIDSTRARLTEKGLNVADAVAEEFLE